MTRKKFRIGYMFVAAMLWTTTPLADSKINVQAQNTDSAKQTTAQVKFVIKIPYKLSLKTGKQIIELSSNTDNVLISQPQQQRSIFASDNSPIQIQDSISGTDIYTVSSP